MLPLRVVVPPLTVSEEVPVIDPVPVSLKVADPSVACAPGAQIFACGDAESEIFAPVVPHGLRVKNSFSVERFIGCS